MKPGVVQQGGEENITRLRPACTALVWVHSVLPRLGKRICVQVPESSQRTQRAEAPCSFSYLFIMDTGVSALEEVLSFYFRYFFFFFRFYSLANWTVIKRLISNDQWPGTVFGIEGAADRKFSFQGVHNVEQSMRLLT